MTESLSISSSMCRNTLRSLFLGSKFFLLPGGSMADISSGHRTANDDGGGYSWGSSSGPRISRTRR
eukprot:1422922-Rhodomonas_salina.1